MKTAPSDVRARKAIFFDVRDTLGVVDRPGHLVPFRPTTEELLKAVRSVVGYRVGVISNLPASVPAEAGQKMLDDAGITPHLDPDGIVWNHDAAVDKPKPDIYAFAARKMGLQPDECIFVGENLLEVLGAKAAGMDAVLKPYPPGREFLLRPLPKEPGSDPKFSGRVSEVVMEEDHLVAKRVVISAATIAKVLRELMAGPEEEREAQRTRVPLVAMGTLVFLTKHFIDPFHHRKEEEVMIPFAVARGFPAQRAAFVAPEHEQGRAYFRGLEIAYGRYLAGDFNALRDFARNAEGVVDLYRDHGRREDDELFPELESYLTDMDDSLLLEFFAQIGPRDVTPYLAVLESMERELGLKPS
ncbi:MAG TPA: HAD-IA family hydrolase [Longimicrobium sp.]|jgi:hemerythrin-like domain-containing protein/beta-phosphoglucomutase-like phosphatase (HAD superfamily)